jgi:DNA-binding MarR family transcriptional regulator
MEVQEQLVNEALTILPELTRALLAGKQRHHAHYEQLREAGLFPDAEEGEPLEPACPADAPLSRPPVLRWGVPEDIPVAQIKLMSYLALRGAQTMSEIAEGLEVTTPAITGLVDKLEKRGLVERLRGSQDRRVVRVQLSPRAQMIAERHLAERRSQMRAVLATLMPEEQRIFVKTLKLLAQTLYTRPGADVSGETPSLVK